LGRACRPDNIKVLDFNGKISEHTEDENDRFAKLAYVVGRIMKKQDCFTPFSSANEDERPESINSSDNNWIRRPGTNNIFRVKFRYLLPIRNGRDHVISKYVVDKGIPIQGEQGGRSWNPFTTGKTHRGKTFLA
jgi:hypothetical protein